MKDTNKIDIYMLDTNGMDLSEGIEENKTVDLDKLIKHTKQKLETSEKKTLRQRFYRANNLVKAAVIAGVILVGGTTVTATALTIAKYIPNRGFTKSENVMVLPVPYTTSMEIEAANGETDLYYLRVVALSYDGEKLEVDLETNWLGTTYDEDGIENGRMHKILYLEGNDCRVDCLIEGDSEYYGLEVGQLHKVFEVNHLEEYSIVLPIDSDVSFTIPLKDLELVTPQEAKSIEQLGEVAEDQGIRIVAVPSNSHEIQNIDFITSNAPADITVEGISKYVMNDTKGNAISPINTQIYDGATSYVLFKSESEFKGSISVSELQVSKSVNQTVEMTLPKAGQTEKINQTITLDGMEIIIETLSADETPDLESGGYWIEVACKVKLSEDSEYSIGEGTQIANVLSYKEVRQSGYSFNNGETWTNMVIPTEEFEPGEKVTLELISVKELSLEGDWNWEIK